MAHFDGFLIYAYRLAGVKYVGIYLEQIGLQCAHDVGRIVAVDIGLYAALLYSILAFATVPYRPARIQPVGTAVGVFRVLSPRIVGETMGRGKVESGLPLGLGFFQTVAGGLLREYRLAQRYVVLPGIIDAFRIGPGARGGCQRQKSRHCR